MSMLEEVTGRGVKLESYQTDEIIVKRQDNIAWIIINRPARMNAVAPHVMEQIGDAIDAVDADISIRCLILTGTGQRAFSAGGDFKPGSTLMQIVAEPLSDFVDFYRRVHRRCIVRMQRMKIPTIAMVNGIAYGAGMDIAMACDIRTGCENSRFASAWLWRGMVPVAGLTWTLPRVIGLGRAQDMFITGRVVDSEEAYRIGILNRLFPADRLEEETLALAREAASKAPLAQAYAKLNCYIGMHMNIESALDTVGGYQSIILRSADFQEAVAAFQERREPTFKGR
ncbi:MAG TPA: enoyl-CoA hydratase/isomerase family protein [Dehalococcoidia bacterium]|nr:enoyl-CoA hydratase/isomerase family protein [Dehalococcoidia bacterium]